MKVVNINDVLKILYKYGEFLFVTDHLRYMEMQNEIANLPNVTPQQKMGHCKDCKYFAYDVVNMNKIPWIVAHEMCLMWGDGCKTKEDGYCFLFEPRAESEGK